VIIMALTITLAGDWMHSLGDRRAVDALVAFDASYPTGGEALTPANLGLGVIDRLEADPKSGYVFQFDYSAQKLMAFVGDNDAGADGPLAQVADTTNLGALTDVHVHAVGA
jgi:hypothetical protein